VVASSGAGFVEEVGGVAVSADVSEFDVSSDESLALDVASGTGTDSVGGVAGGVAMSDSVVDACVADDEDGVEALVVVAALLRSFSETAVEELVVGGDCGVSGTSAAPASRELSGLSGVDVDCEKIT
jgi:hypothetical protein